MSPTSLQTTIAWAAVVAVAVTAAAPQSDGEPVLTIDGQRCTCVMFYMCLANDTISPSSSTQLGCTDDLICCRLQNDSPLPHEVTESIVPSTELPHKTSVPPQEPYVENNKPCTCVSKNQCLPSYGNEERQHFTRAGNCGTNKVCCINEYVNIGSTQETQHVNGGSDDNNNVRSCGIGVSPPDTLNFKTLATRITNPNDNSNTYRGQFPWMAAILKSDTNAETGVTTENVFVCGGSLIHPRVILTAAHCTKGLNFNVVKVRISVWDTQSSDNEEGKSQDRGVSKIIYHPQHNNGTMFNDVALIELESEVILNQHTNILCIPGSDEKHINYDSQSCVSTGWGIDAFGRNSNFQFLLKKVDLSLVPNDLCQQKLRNTRLGKFFILDESFICAGGIKGEDVCKGDGGGPLICELKGQSKEKKYIQVGIVSWGIGCGDQDIPGVYSSLIANSKWIHKALKTITQ